MKSEGVGMGKGKKALALIKQIQKNSELTNTNGEKKGNSTVNNFGQFFYRIVFKRSSIWITYCWKIELDLIHGDEIQSSGQSV